MNLSVVIPIRRDTRAGEAIAELRSWAVRRRIEIEIIVCGQLLPAQHFDGVLVLPIVPALKGQCVRDGVMASKGAVILVCDADLPVSVVDLEMLISAVADADVVAARRRGCTSLPVRRRVASAVFRTLARALAGVPENADPQCGVKVYRAVAAHRLFAAQVISGLAYEVEVMRRARDLGMQVVHVPVKWKSDSTTITLWRESPRMLVDLVRFWFLMWVRPNRAMEPSARPRS